MNLRTKRNLGNFDLHFAFLEKYEVLRAFQTAPGLDRFTGKYRMQFSF